MIFIVPPGLPWRIVHIRYEVRQRSGMENVAHFGGGTGTAGLSFRGEVGFLLLCWEGSAGVFGSRVF